MTDKKTIDKKTWLIFGLVIMVLLVVTTPGWKEVLGVNFEISLGQYAPALLLLGFMGVLLGIVLIGGDKKDDKEE